ncbi:hypothetical protein GH714_037895 [Hevea brasiliensis]|uniref:Protein kinase domain-containing protein n=1 Tax=Hevea brasiliensis TaxID=3981 RepID=A0A6A6M4K0_HEVBR|nr:hypothetical protein GH714_037895 [Hevea brasiliensis]
MKILFPSLQETVVLLATIQYCLHTSPLYQTARIYRQPSPYELIITDNGTYLVRLHFYAFSSKGTNLSEALFSVSTSKFLLLSNFSVKNTSHLPVIKEFLLTINEEKLRIYFIPATETSFAFLNALEVLILPQEFIKDEYAVAVPPIGTGNGTFHGLLFHAFQTLYRIDVGQNTNISNDPFWRDWVGDDPYLLPGSSARNCAFYSGKLNHAPGATVVQDMAPDLVKLSMSFAFTSATISKSPGTLKFDLYIYTKFSWVVDSAEVNGATLAAPFFADYVIESDDSGYINFSIVPNNDSEMKNAFLNGVEIMDFLTNTRMNLGHLGHPSKHLDLVIGLSVGFGSERPYGLITANPVPNLNLKLKMPFSEIQAATRDFDTKLLIGESGFGKVYKGTLPTGMKVAVKRSDASHGQGLPEFQTGTLRDHLYIWKENSKIASVLPKLTWKRRLEICIGLPDPDHCRMGLIGSFGYLDPEYVRTLQLTGKSDVYSFGVVLLEMLYARPPIVNSIRRGKNLAEWGMFWQKKGEVEKIVDPSLAGHINPNSLRKFGEIAEKCMQIEGANRPTMLDVCWDLEYALQLQQTAVSRETC